eukprot:gene25414-biopygen16497
MSGWLEGSIHFSRPRPPLTFRTVFPWETTPNCAEEMNGQTAPRATKNGEMPPLLPDSKDSRSPAMRRARARAATLCGAHACEKCFFAEKRQSITVRVQHGDRACLTCHRASHSVGAARPQMGGRCGECYVSVRGFCIGLLVHCLHEKKGGRCGGMRLLTSNPAVRELPRRVRTFAVRRRPCARCMGASEVVPSPPSFLPNSGARRTRAARPQRSVRRGRRLRRPGACGADVAWVAGA